MGDRGNIVIRSQSWTGQDSQVWLYTHWRGSDIAEITARALNRRQRWDNPSYLARIIFDELTKGDTGGEVGYGISDCIRDNSHPVLVVDCGSQTVYTVPEDDLILGKLPPRQPQITGDFEHFEYFIQHELKEVPPNA